VLIILFHLTLRHTTGFVTLKLLQKLFFNYTYVTHQTHSKMN